MAELRTVARPYAKAAFHKARETNALGGWSDALEQLGKISMHSQVAGFIASPSVTPADKASKLAEIGGDELTQDQKNFLSVLADNNRLSLLPEIYSLFEELKSAEESVVPVVVTTAYALDDSAEQKIAAALQSRFSSNVSVETAVDSSLLGGALIKVGDAVIDGSVKGRLAKLATAMNS